MQNSELIGAESGLLGIDIASVAAVTKNRSVDKLLSELRECTGMQIIARDNAMRRLVKRLKGDGKIAFLLDQYTAEKKGGVLVMVLQVLEEAFRDDARFNNC